MTRKYWGPTTQPTTPNHPPKPNQPLVNQLEVLKPSLGLDLIDSQSSNSYYLKGKYTYYLGLNHLSDRLPTEKAALNGYKKKNMDRSKIEFFKRPTHYTQPPTKTQPTFGQSIIST